MTDEEILSQFPDYKKGGLYEGTKDYWKGVFEHQTCHDPNLHNSFSKLHEELVNRVISWCKENNVECDDFSLGIDGIVFSIPYGQWTPSTDSSCSFRVRSNDKKPFLYEL